MSESLLGFALSPLAVVKEFIFFYLTGQNFYYTSEISKLFHTLKNFKNSC